MGFLWVTNNTLRGEKSTFKKRKKVKKKQQLENERRETRE